MLFKRQDGATICASVPETDEIFGKLKALQVFSGIVYNSDAVPDLISDLSDRVSVNGSLK